MLNKSRATFGPELGRLIELLAKVQGLGPKSARRAVLALLKRKDNLMRPLAEAMLVAADQIKPCKICGNLDTMDPCAICLSDVRDKSVICVVADVSDLWAFERTQGFRGTYHVLGGLLNALDDIGPSDLKISDLLHRAESGEVNEIILALAATVDGQSTAHYLAQVLEPFNVKLTRLSHGLPIGGELDHIDESTLIAALMSRLAV
ncbi:MAG: recombination protein RecR [Hyphomonadaceae bacterium]|nr:MAG: recombination protein RecR [Hyphomonadaceae bacterium]